MSLFNDACSNATIISLDSFLIGQTISATANLTDVICGTSIDGPGVWYRTIGQGFPLKAHTCDSATDFDTKLSIFRGSCDSLDCVFGNDDFIDSSVCIHSDVHSHVAWETNVGENYYILVHGFEGQIGNFGIHLENVSVPLNDQCEDAAVATSENLGQITHAASTDEIISCDNVMTRAPGVWYKLTGNGSILRAHTCSYSTTFDTQLSVYTGNCQNLQCVAANDDAPPQTANCTIRPAHSSVEWLAETEEDYYILVHGFTGEVGTFDLFIDGNFSVPLNDQCGTAAELNDFLLGQTTIGAMLDENLQGCGVVTIDTQGVWYQILGTGAALQVDTCGPETDFDTQLSLFEGSCELLTCVDENDDAPISATACMGTPSAIRWQSQVDQEYHLLVHGFEGATGNFELFLESIPTPLNDECAMATRLTKDSVMGETTFNASPESLSCDEVSTNAAGVWYVVQGTGDSLRAHTCSPTTFLDTQISVFTGSCDNLECVVANDDASENNCTSTQSSVSWESTANQDYYILVHGFESAGDFDLLMEGTTTSSPSLGPSTVTTVTTVPTINPTATRASPTTLSPVSIGTPTGTPTRTPGSTTSRSTKSDNTAAIAGGAAGGGVALVGAGILLFCCLRKRQYKTKTEGEKPESILPPEQTGHQSENTDREVGAVNPTTARSLQVVGSNPSEPSHHSTSDVYLPTEHDDDSVSL